MSSQTSSAKPPASPASHKSTLLIVFITVFIDLLGFGIVLPLLPRYGTSLNASGAQLGLLMASFSAMQFVFAPMWGALSDRVGRRPILLLGLLGSTLSYLLFGFVSSFGREGLFLGLGTLSWLFITRIGAGIAGATISTAQAVIADCTGVKNRGRGMAMIGAAFGIGFTFGPLIGAACVTGVPNVALDDAQYQTVAELSATEQSIASDELIEMLKSAGPLSEKDQQAIGVLLPGPESRKTVSERLTAPPPSAPGYVAGGLSGLAFLLALIMLKESLPRDPGARSATEHRSWLNFGRLLRHLSAPQLSRILIAIFITTFGFAQFESTLSLLTESLGYDLRWNFLLYAYIGFVLTIGQGMLVRRFLPRIGEHRMAMTGVVLMAVGFVLMGATGQQHLPAQALWWILPLITIGFSAVNPSLQSLLSQAAAQDEQGGVLGTGQSLSSLARIFGPAIGIQLLREWSLSMPYFLAAGLVCIGGAIVAFATKPAPSERSEISE
ncbi:MAG: MFS transporter [Planctomycetaceae bacterium]|nr:MFS transporter [Planctomycetaceae bacterium]